MNLRRTKCLAWLLVSYKSFKKLRALLRPRWMRTYGFKIYNWTWCAFEANGGWKDWVFRLQLVENQLPVILPWDEWKSVRATWRLESTKPDCCCHFSSFTLVPPSQHMSSCFFRRWSKTNCLWYFLEMNGKVCVQLEGLNQLSLTVAVTSQASP